jgi:hypothetical protein
VGVRDLRIKAALRLKFSLLLACYVTYRYTYSMQGNDWHA